MRELAALTGPEGGEPVAHPEALRCSSGSSPLKDGPRRARVPAVVATRVHLEIDLTGHYSAVAIDGPC